MNITKDGSYSSSLSVSILTAFLGVFVVVGLTGEWELVGGHRLLGDGTADIWGHSWGYGWVARSLAHGQFPLERAPISFPQPQKWWIIDMPVAVLLMPVTRVLGTAFAFNLAMLGHVFIGAGSVAGLCLRRQVAPGVAVLAGILAVTSPFVRGIFVSGIPEGLSVLLVPLFILLLEGGLLGRRLQWFGAVTLAPILVLDGAYGAISGALAGIFVLAQIMWSSTERWRVFGRGVFVGLSAGAALAGLHWVLKYTQHPTTEDSFRNIGGIGDYWALQPLEGSDLLSWFTPHLLLPLSIPESPHRHIVYVGLLLTAFIVVAAWSSARVRRDALLVGLSFVLALGPVLYIGGVAQSAAVLPGIWIWATGASNLYRLGGLVPCLGLVVVASGFAATRWRRFSAFALLLVGCEWWLGAPLAVSIPTTPDPAGVVEEYLLTNEEKGAVLDLPFDREGRKDRGPHPQRTFYLQSIHQRPIASALYNIAPMHFRVPVVGALDKAVSSAWRREQSTDGGEPAELSVIPPAPYGEDAADARLALVQRGFRFVTLDLELVVLSQRADALFWAKAWLGEPVVVSEDGLRHVWRVEGEK